MWQRKMLTCSSHGPEMFVYSIQGCRWAGKGFPSGELLHHESDFNRLEEAIQIIDDYTQPSNAHRLLKSSWTGRTDFQELAA